MATFSQTMLLSKLLNLLAQPLNLALLLLLLGLLLEQHRPRTAKRLLFAGVLVLALTGMRPLPDALLSTLEEQSPEVPANADLSGYAGMVVLGGSMESGRIAEHYQQPLLKGSAERLTMAMALWRRNPALRIVFTGGEGELFGTGPAESERARRFFASQGLPPEALTLESRSSNTYQNAIFTRELPGVHPQQRWLLVTSAGHMPRSLAVFRKAGWNVTPYPVDFRTAGLAPWSDYSLSEGAVQWEAALHEWIGIATYHLLGRI